MSFLLSHRITAVVKSNARNKLHHSRGFPSQSGEICEAIFSLSFSNRENGWMAQFSAAGKGTKLAQKLVKTIREQQKRDLRHGGL